VLAFAGKALLARVLADMVGGSLPAPGAASLMLGPITALAMILAFALPPLAQLRRVPPLRVLRKDVAPSPAVLVAYASAAIGIVVMLLLVLRETRMVLLSAFALAATLGALYVVGWLLVYSLKSVRGRGGAAWRYGLANLARRRRESVVQLAAFGLGLMVLLLLSVVRGDLLAAWQATLPADAPNNFLINIQPHEREPLSAIFARHDVEPPEYWPLVRARLAEINDVAVRDIMDVSPRGRRFLEREANLSWSQDLQVGNRLTDGVFWNDAGEPAGVSVETEFAESLGLALGDRLVFDVAGEPVAATVTSFRLVEWDSFRPNFFMLLSPGLLREEAGTFISAAHVPRDRRQLFIDIARELPGVTVFDLEALIGQVRGVMDKAALAVQIVFLFTLAAGIVVLLAAVQASLGERRYEAAMLRTLGARRGLVLRAVATEFVVVGMLAGLLGAIGAGAAGAALARNVFELEYVGSGSLAIVGLIAGAVLVGVSGTFAARSAVSQPPVTVLRE
jgi:putative ABC transport system permease protein